MTCTSRSRTGLSGPAQADVWQAALRLIVATGMRRGELLGLRWQDVGFDASSLSVRQSLIAIHHALRFETLKNDKGRAIRLDPEEAAALRAYKSRQAAERQACGPAWTDTGLVFTREDGQPLHPDAFSKTFGKLSKAAGVRAIRLHDLRHGYATIALREGVPLKVVQQVLGHSSIAVTGDIYSHVLAELDERAAAAISRAITGAIGRGWWEGRGDATKGATIFAFRRGGRASCRPTTCENEARGGSSVG
jgi:integrase